MKILKKRILVAFMGIIAVYGFTKCSSNSGNQGNAANGSNQQNEMSGQDQKDWEVLFGGESMDKWKNFNSSGINPEWQVQNGNMVLTEGGGGYLITKKEYQDFELQLEWKISKGGNSGIFFNVIEHDSLNGVPQTGPEYQLLDNENADDNKVDTHLAAANYDLHAPSVDASKPAGEWNSTKLIVNDGHVEHWLNGKKVVEYELWSDEWKEKVANSKFKNFPYYGTAKKGHIALQDHGQKIWFRNIKIREL